MESRRDVQRKQSHVTGLKILRRTLLTILVIILVLWVSYAIANHPKAQAQREATSIAKKYGHLRSTNGFYIFNREKTYYTVTGKNQKGQQMLVMVPKSGGNVRLIKQSKGITSQQARQKVQNYGRTKKVLRVAPGIFNDKVVWEVTYINKKGALCYDLLNFRNGNYVQQIDNL